MEFTQQHFIALLPLLITCATVVVVMLAIAWRRNHRLSYVLSAAGLILALLSIAPASQVAPLDVTGLLMLDSFAFFYTGLMLVATLVCVTLAHAYLGEKPGTGGFPGNREELYLLMLLAVAGGIVLVSAQHLAGMIFGLAQLSVPDYGLVAYSFFDRRSRLLGIQSILLSSAVCTY